MEKKRGALLKHCFLSLKKYGSFPYSFKCLLSFFFNYKYKIELVHIKSSSKSEQINVLSCPNTLNTDTSLNCDSEIPIKIRSG